LKINDSETHRAFVIQGGKKEKIKRGRVKDLYFILFILL